MNIEQPRGCGPTRNRVSDQALGVNVRKCADSATLKMLPVLAKPTAPAKKQFSPLTKSFRACHEEKLKPSRPMVRPNAARGSVHDRVARHGEYQMMSTSSKLKRCAWMVATALMLAMPTASQAYTVEQEEMCSGDAMRLCFSEIPNVDRITACMERQRESLSAGCRAVFEVNTPAASAAAPVHTASPRHTAPAHNKQTAKPSKPVTPTPKPKHD
jgi:hypothetical protein